MKMKNISTYFTRTACALLLLAVSAGCEAFPTDDSGFTPEPPELSIRANEVENVPREKTILTIPVESNLPWHAGTDAGWISFEKARGTGDGDCVVSVALNTSRDERTGTVRIWITDDAVKTFRITQAPTVPGENPMDYYVKTDGDGTADGLSWEKATTLQNALSMAVFGDKVHLAAGTYTPWETVTGGSTGNAGDKAFELASNVTLIGGYPADATEGAEYAPAANETIFSGAMDDGMAYHTVVVTAAPDPDWKLTVKGITITGGSATSTGNVPINGTNINRNLGGGVVIVGSAVDFVDCTIKNNMASTNGNIHVISGSVASFENCVISGNNSNSNCAALFNNASTVTINNCTFDSNLAVGVGGAVYAYNTTSKSYTYIYNSMFTGNEVDSGNANATRRGAGFYGRENSETVIVNCTFSGNKGGNGGAVSAYGTAAAPCKVDIISCTITGNTAKTSGGGVDIANTSATVRMYNTIVSGNTASVTTNSDIFLDGGSNFAEKMCNVEGADVYDLNGGKVATPFDPATMLGPLADNGGKTKTIALTGSSNPALTNGMPVSALTALGLGYTPEIPEEVIAYDQRGVSRSGKTAIGAWVNE